MGGVIGGVDWEQREGATAAREGGGSRRDWTKVGKKQVERRRVMAWVVRETVKVEAVATSEEAVAKATTEEEREGKEDVATMEAVTATTKANLYI